MLQGNWKSRTLLFPVVFVAGGLLLLSLVSLTALPLMGWTGFLPLAVMLLMTFGAGRLTVPIMKADGHSHSQKSVAETLIFLATMMYAVAPASTIAPAVILAAFVGYISSSQSSDRRGTIFTTCAAIISTCAAALLYSLLVHLLASSNNPENGLPFGILLLPLCVLALVQYFLSTLGTAAFMAFESGDARLSLHRDTLVWTSVTQVGSAASAALFYTALHGGGLPFIFVGFLIIGLVYMLYRFDEQRVLEAQRAEVEKMRHIQEIADLHMNTIESLAIAIDAKDQTTHGHVRRTQIYATEMGKVLNVSEAELQALLAGALLHDIGKLAVPEYILNKPGKLTESEFAKMKIHPTVGGDILKRVNFPYPVEDIVRYHHEKWDGTGYPKGLKANSIPLVARIISVIDFYDATRCDRPYRKGMKREESLALLKQMSGSSFDPHIVERFTQHIIEFDTLIAAHDIQEQVSADNFHDHNNARPDAGLSNGVLGAPDEDLGFRSITEAQREVFALHEIAQTIGSSLNLQDTVALVSNKLRAIVPFDTCIIFLVDEKTGKAVPVHVAGDNAEVFARRRMNIGEGVTGWVIANGRSMCNASPELDLVGVPEEISSKIRGVVVSPLIREDGAFGAITLYSNNRSPYTTENVRLLESVSQHAASALNNAMTFEKTKESALTDQLTDLPNARAFYMMLEQRIAECQRLNRESLAVICMDVDDFKKVNDQFGHTVGDRVLANIAGVIKKELRQMDILTRYAGDEFVAIMPMASTLMAGMVAERIRSAVQSQKFEVRAGKFIEINVSMGISCFPADGETTEHLLTSAARNMQQDKHARKTVVTLSASPNINSYDLFT